MYKPNKIIELMENSFLTQKELYTALGISKSGFEKIVSGKSFPRSDNLLAIADYFGVSMDLFFDRVKSTKVDVSDSFEMLLNKYTQAISENERLKMEVEKLKMQLEEKLTNQVSMAASAPGPYKKG